jgi:FkbM family methyltransferase
MNKPKIELIAYAQNAEDIILMRAFKSFSKGFYVDVGAGHPVRGSLTKNLYDILKFNGLEIEPLDQFASELRKHRSRNKVINVGCGQKSEDSTFFECASNWAMSTFDYEVYQSNLEKGHSFLTRNCALLTLDEILENAGNVSPEFELLKIDVEGYEDMVINGFSISKWKPKIIVMETTSPGTSQRITSIASEVILSSGYSEVLFDGINSFFVSNNCPDLASSIRVPVNKMDYFIHLIWWRYMPQKFRMQYPHLQQKEFGYPV